MNILNDVEVMTSAPPLTSRIKVRMLEQMAEALEDEAAGLYRRAAAFEEDEFLLNREIEERQTEINRLLLKLESLRSERDGVLEKIESITSEAAQMRQEAFGSEDDEVAFRAITCTRAEDEMRGHYVAVPDQDNQPNGSMYFRRLTLADSAC
jgi:predicted RNase H-like nuclease (RuvC/YqgF family)